MKPKVVLVMPRRGKLAAYDSMVALLMATRGACEPIVPAFAGSILDHVFNRAWHAALDLRDQAGATHFAMLHDDVCPIVPGTQNPLVGWLDVMLEELERLQREARPTVTTPAAGLLPGVLSAVVPQKSGDGLTSTGIWDPSDPPWRVRRLTLHEVFALPETFGNNTPELRPFLKNAFPDPGFVPKQTLHNPGAFVDEMVERERLLRGVLLINTGLWVADLRQPWCDEVLFETRCHVVKGAG